MRLLGACLLALLAGCATDDQSLIVVGTAAVTPMTMCQAMPTSMVLQSSGILDIDLVARAPSAQGYVLFPIVKNNLVERAGGMVPERDNIQILAFDVQLQLPVAVSQPDFTVAVSGGSIGPGAEVATSFVGLPRSIAVQQASAVAAAGTGDLPTAIIKYRAVGRRADGTITSGWDNFPVALCAGCLETGPSCSDPNNLPKTSQIQTGGCVLGQDSIITCCTDPTGAFVCGSAVPTSM